jgi:enoyl-CoA hydratase/carnithine racemase
MREKQVNSTAAVNLLQHGDGIFSLELSNPSKRNALTPGMWEVVIAHLQSLPSAGCRVIIVHGYGDHFCSGADVSSLGSTASGKNPTAITAEGLETLRSIRVPTIAAIRGSCLGGGLAVAMACDFQIADASARFGIPAARLGLVFSVRQTRILVTQVGLASARRLLLLGETVSAEEARVMGLVSEVSAMPVHERAMALACSLVENAPLSLEGSKKVLLDAVEATTERPIDATLEDMIGNAKESQDHAEAKRAFAEKRKPVFSGR